MLIYLKNKSSQKKITPEDLHGMSDDYSEQSWLF